MLAAHVSGISANGAVVILLSATSIIDGGIGRVLVSLSVIVLRLVVTLPSCSVSKEWTLKRHLGHLL